jgi:hypothetical protein
MPSVLSRAVFLIRHWRDYFPDMAYDTTFGLSESTAQPASRHREHAQGGRDRLPGFNRETRVVDENGVDMPNGEPRTDRARQRRHAEYYRTLKQRGYSPRRLALHG